MTEEKFLDLTVYQRLEKIGQGGFGKVFKIQEKSTGKIFAAKVSLEKLSKKNKSIFTSIHREINIMAKISHPSILKFIGYSEKSFNNRSRPVIITEYSHNGSLKDILKHERGLHSQNLNSTKKLINIFGIASAMSFLHLNNIIHRDLKPANILENEYLFPQIADFGLSKKFHENTNSMTSQSTKKLQGTYTYISPEGLQNNTYTKAGDVYAFSLIVYEIMTLQEPYKDFNLQMLFAQVVHQQYRPKFLTPIKDCYKNLIEKCWAHDPKDRPTFDEIVNDLKTNEEFILDDVDKEEFLNYIESIENSQISFDANKKFTKITVLKKRHHKKDFQNEDFKNYEEYLNKHPHNIKKKISKLNSLRGSSSLSLSIMKIKEERMRKRSDFEISHKIFGKGSSGYVRIAKDKENGQKVAFKEMYPCVDDIEEDKINREIEILAKIDHYSIQKLYGYIEESINGISSSVILTIFEENGSLEKFIQKKGSSSLDFTQKYIMMYGIAAALDHLHKKNVVHGRVSPKSILVTDQIEPKLTNFYHSKMATNDQILQSLLVDEPVYIAPELLQMEEEKYFSIHNAKLFDVFAFSFVVYFIFTGERPWYDIKQPMFIPSKIESGERPELPSDLPKLLLLLIQACWNQEPIKRPTFSIILDIIGSEHFLNNLDDKVDKTRFKEYQNKVLYDDSFKFNNYVFIDGIPFPKIPSKMFVSPHKYKITNYEVGNNSYFNVREAKRKKKTDGIFQIYKLKEEYCNDNEILDLYSSQISVLLSVDHPALTKLYGCFEYPSKVISKEFEYDSIYDYFSKYKELPEIIVSTTKSGNLLSNIHNLSITDKFIIIYGIVSGMSHLHSRGIVHLNLNPENILLERNEYFYPIIKIGITAQKEDKKVDLFSILSEFSYSYVAPELIEMKSNEKLNLKKCDVYSFAMICYFILTGISPWGKSNDYQFILMNALNGERPKTKGIISYPFVELIENCWNKDPSKRPSFKYILDKIGSPIFVKTICNINFYYFQQYQKIVEKQYIPLQLFIIRTKDEFETVKIISKSAFAIIKVVNDKINKKIVAYKEIIIPKCSFIERAQLFARINFPSIIKPIDIIKPSNDKVYGIIILPYASNGNLDALLKIKRINYTQRCIILYGIAMGMLKLHDQGIAHKNLHPKNILINSFCEPWISGFVTSNSLMNIDICYMSPEALSIFANSEVQFDEQISDVYSFGMIAYYLITGVQPYGDNNDNNYYKLFERVKTEKPLFLNDIEQHVIDLISSCWDDPIKRPTFKQICDIISDPKFYMNPYQKFDRKRFYDYQMKLGELRFIKFDKNEIENFEKVNSNENNRNAICLKADKLNHMKNDLDSLFFFKKTLENRNPDETSFTISADKIDVLYENDLFSSQEFDDIIQIYDDVSIEINYPSDSFEPLLKKLLEKMEKYKKILDIDVIISNIPNFIGFPRIYYVPFSVTIYSSVTSIGPNAFKDCSSLIDIKLPETLAKIGRSAFEGCSHLSKIYIPHSVIKIGENAFKGCIKLDYIFIQSSMLMKYNEKFLGIEQSTKVIAC